MENSSGHEGCMKHRPSNGLEIRMFKKLQDSLGRGCQWWWVSLCWGYVCKHRSKQWSDWSTGSSIMHCNAFCSGAGAQDLVLECEIKGLVMDEPCADGPINLRIGHILHAIRLLGSSIKHIIYSWLYLYTLTSIEASNWSEKKKEKRRKKRRKHPSGDLNNQWLV